MKKSVTHPIYGIITYEENIWSGKKTVSVNGNVLQKTGKNTFLFMNGETGVAVTLRGSVLTGVTLQIQNEQISVIAKPAWYEWILAVLPLALNLIWGNSVALCSIIPVVGGAVGGALGGAAMVICMGMMREKTVGGKLLTALVTVLATFAAGAVLGYLILSMMAS